MDHLADIKRLIGVLLASSRFHLLIVKGAPGWAKTHTTRCALRDSGVAYELLGAYSTPLALFNKMAENPSQLLVVDDTAGLFHNALALSVLNSATWPSADASAKRQIRWTSTTEKALVDSVLFDGKLIILTNFLPNTPQVNALANRALSYEIEIEPGTVGKNLITAAQSIEHFPNTELAVRVAEFLGEQALISASNKISLRTLEQGYEIATIDPQGWQDLLLKLLPKSAVEKMAPETLVEELSLSGLKIEDQVHRFCQETGKSRRTFFYLRSRAGIKHVSQSAKPAELTPPTVLKPKKVLPRSQELVYENVDQ